MWAPQLVDEAAARCRNCATWPATSRTAGLQAQLVIDRDTASRLGITPQTIDDTLYDAFGQRQVSTMFTQLNQYHVVLEVDPQFQQNPDSLKNIYVHVDDGQPGAAQRRSRHFEPDNAPLAVNHQGQFPGGDAVVQSGARRFAGRGGEGDQAGRAGHWICQPAFTPAFRERRRRSRIRSSNEPYLILAALVTVYIVLGVLYESYIHPITILSTLPSAGVGAILALIVVRNDLERHRADRHHSADRHREEERHHDDRLRARGGARGRQAAATKRSIRPACCASVRS